jgi:CRISPR-associated protein Csx17
MANSILLTGCSPVPIAYYLKALGMIKIVSEQIDTDARGRWSGNSFEISGSFSKESVMEYLVRDYKPVPMIAPWNGGSGFYYQEGKMKEKDPVSGKKLKTGKRDQPTEATRTVDAILASKAMRLHDYRNAIQLTKMILNVSNRQEAPDKVEKQMFIQNMRNNLPDSTLSWLDAAVVLTSEKPTYPPLLGTGGNDGNLDYSSNFMQRIIGIMDLESGDPTGDSKRYLESSLFTQPIKDLIPKIAIGQFFPGSVGGPNSSTGFDSESLVNPWDFILMMEGATLFAASSSKRTGQTGHSILRYPFTVRTVSAGYGSSAGSDEGDTREGEIWVPLWERHMNLSELKLLLSEGRAMLGRKNAVNGSDFARSTAMLGVDRGISSFQRYGFQMRNGKSFFATSLGRFQVKRRPEVDLLMEIDYWMDNFRRNSRKDHTPNSIPRTMHNLDESVMDLCQDSGPRRVQEVLVKLGQSEKAMVNSKKWTKENNLKPVPLLSPKWLLSSDDGSPEFRIAASLASVYGKYKDCQGKQRTITLRSNMEPAVTTVKEGKAISFFNEDNEADVVWMDGNLISSLIRVMDRRITNASHGDTSGYPDRGMAIASFSDIQSFIDGTLNDRRIEDLLWGLILIDWYSAWEFKNRLSYGDNDVFPGYVYAVPKLCFPGMKINDEEIPMVPEIIRKLSSGDIPGAISRAERRIRGSGITVTVKGAQSDPQTSKRIAASLLIPISQKQLDLMIEHVAVIDRKEEMR